MADLSQTAQNPSGDFIRATPRNPVLGFLSDIVGASYSPQRTQQMQGIARLFSAPAISQTLDRLAFGEPLTTGAGGIGGTSKPRPEVMEAGLAVTDLLPTSAAAKGAALAVPALAGIFMGPKSKTWDALAAQKAKMLADIGTDPRTIWQQTGTWKGPDGKWRQEIDDSSSRLDERSLRYFEAAQANSPLRMDKLSGVLSHRKAYGAYPATQDIGLDLTSSQKGGAYAAQTSTGPEAIALGQTPDAKSTLLHELQHAIQQREGFAKGGSPSSMILTLEDLANQKRQQAQEMFRISSANDPLDPLRLVKPGARKKGMELEKEARELDSKALAAYRSEQAKFDLYQRLGGEAEARATQSRMNMTPEQRRAIFPEESYDVPLNELIIRGASD